MKKLLLTLGAFALCSCASKDLPNPFVCNTESQTALTKEVNAAPVKFDRNKLNYALHIGDVRVSATSFATNADFNGLLAAALSKANLPNAVVVIDTDVDVCNLIQEAYIKYIIAQTKAHAIKTDKVVFVDAKNGQLLQADKVASIGFGFYILDKDDIYPKFSLF